MVEHSPRLSLPLIQPSQAQKHVTHNSALELLDVISQLHVIAIDAQTPPASAANGDAYALGDAPQLEWAGQPQQIALRANGGWLFVTPRNGWRLWDETGQELYVRHNDDWLPLTSRQNIPGVGVNTSFDATNRLSVAASATLLTHEHAGGGHQLKVNKDIETSTASLLFQTGYGGRAEMGTMGSDDFAIKVSGDGSQFVTALSFDKTTGLASGDAVQQSADDVTPGRLMRADYGYGPGNVVGTVAEAAGLPTGAIIQSASTGTGDYIRFADGTQICSEALQLDYADPSKIEALWEFPVPFAYVPQGISGSLNARSVLNNAAPQAEELGPVLHANMNHTQTKILIHRIPGQTDFLPGDLGACRVTAFGRWF